MAGKTVINVGNWGSLDQNKITNLFLYGQIDTPSNYSDRIRLPDAPDIAIQLDMGPFINGPGRYALPALAPFVRNFFGGQTYGLQGEYTVAQLKSVLQLSDAEFNISFQHYAMDTISGDYASRTYIYNSAGFRLSDDTVFVFDGDNSLIKNLKVRAFDDNFDFNSNSWPATLGNLLLKPAIDPYDLGRTVEIQIRGTEVPTIPIYDRARFQSDFDFYNNNYRLATSLSVAQGAMNGVIDSLEAAQVIEYFADDGTPIAYGSHLADVITKLSVRQLQASEFTDFIAIGGPGDDRMIGGTGDDSFVGGPGQGHTDRKSG